MAKKQIEELKEEADDTHTAEMKTVMFVLLINLISRELQAPNFSPG